MLHEKKLYAKGHVLYIIYMNWQIYGDRLLVVKGCEEEE